MALTRAILTCGLAILVFTGSSYSFQRLCGPGLQPNLHAQENAIAYSQDSSESSTLRQRVSSVSPDAPFPTVFGICYVCDPFCVFVDIPACQLPPMTAYIQAMVNVPPGPCTLGRIDTVFKITDPAGNPVQVTATNIPFGWAFEITTEGPYTIVAKNSRGVSTFTQQGSIACWSESQRSWSREKLKAIGWTLSRKVTVGEIGARSLTFSAGSEECIKRNLPATGSVASLPEGFGDVVFDHTTCQNSPSLSGILDNALLGNTLAMALSFKTEEDLPYAPICATMIAEALAPGRGPWHGNEDDRRSVSIAPAVIDALTSLHFDTTAGGLLRLSNRALAGSADLGGATLDDINSAVSAINDAFTGGAFVLTCRTADSRANLQITFDADEVDYLGSLINLAQPGSVPAGPSIFTVKLDEYGGVGVVLDRATIDHFSFYDDAYLFTETLPSQELSGLLVSVARLALTFPAMAGHAVRFLSPTARSTRM